MEDLTGKIAGPSYCIWFCLVLGLGLSHGFTLPVSWIAFLFMVFCNNMLIYLGFQDGLDIEQLHF